MAVGQLCRRVAIIIGYIFVCRRCMKTLTLIWRVDDIRIVAYSTPQCDVAQSHAVH